MSIITTQHQVELDFMFFLMKLALQMNRMEENLAVILDKMRKKVKSLWRLLHSFTKNISGFLWL